MLNQVEAYGPPLLDPSPEKTHGPCPVTASGHTNQTPPRFGERLAIG